MSCFSFSPQKIVTTGNRTALTDLSEAEIALLQRLDPAIALAPGQSTPFLIVFLEPPRVSQPYALSQLHGCDARWRHVRGCRQRGFSSGRSGVGLAGLAWAG